MTISCGWRRRLHAEIKQMQTPAAAAAVSWICPDIPNYIFVYDSLGLQTKGTSGRRAIQLGDTICHHGYTNCAAIFLHACFSYQLKYHFPPIRKIHVIANRSTVEFVTTGIMKSLFRIPIPECPLVSFMAYYELSSRIKGSCCFGVADKTNGPAGNDSRVE